MIWEMVLKDFMFHMFQLYPHQIYLFYKPNNFSLITDFCKLNRFEAQVAFFAICVSIHKVLVYHA